MYEVGLQVFEGLGWMSARGQKTRASTALPMRVSRRIDQEDDQQKGNSSTP